MFLKNFNEKTSESGDSENSTRSLKIHPDYPVCLDQGCYGNTCLFPEWYDRNFKLGAILLFVSISWLIGIGTMSYNFTAYKHYDTRCALEWNSSLEKTLSGFEELTIMVLLPVSIMSLLYFLVYKRVKEFNRLFNDEAPVSLPSNASIE